MLDDLLAHVAGETDLGRRKYIAVGAAAAVIAEAPAGAGRRSWRRRTEDLRDRALQRVRRRRPIR